MKRITSGIPIYLITLALVSCMEVDSDTELDGPEVSSEAYDVNVGPKKFPSRDVGTVTVGCQNLEFLVSLNDDDDDGNGVQDRRQAKKPASEDNLREFSFSYGEADRVFVSRPTGLGTRVRAFSDRRGTPFDFSVSHVTSSEAPVVMYLEGIKPSAFLGDVIFELNYYAGKYPLCGPAAFGSVVGVSAGLAVSRRGHYTTRKGSGSGASFNKRNKMLITGTAEATAVVRPKLPGTWSYDGDGTFAAPGAFNTTFTAGHTFTPIAQLNRHNVSFSVILAGQTINAQVPVNLAAPRHVRSVNTRRCRGSFSGVSPRWIDANKGRMSLFNRCVKYSILDQWNRNLKAETAYAGRMPQIRENIGDVLTSPIPAVRQWIANNLRWTQAWKDKPNGYFTDRLAATRINKNPIVNTIRNRRTFHPELRNKPNGVMFHLRNGAATATHSWYLSVNGVDEVTATENTFSVVRANSRKAGGDIQIKLRSSYRVITL